MALDQPAFVVGPPEFDRGEAAFLDGPEGPDPEEVLLERPDEASGAAVAMKSQEAFDPIRVPSMFDSLEVTVVYPA